MTEIPPVRGGGGGPAGGRPSRRIRGRGAGDGGGGGGGGRGRDGGPMVGSGRPWSLGVAAVRALSAASTRDSACATASRWDPSSGPASAACAAAATPSWRPRSCSTRSTSAGAAGSAGSSASAASSAISTWRAACAVAARVEVQPGAEGQLLARESGLATGEECREARLGGRDPASPSTPAAIPNRRARERPSTGRRRPARRRRSPGGPPAGRRGRRRGHADRRRRGGARGAPG